MPRLGCRLNFTVPYLVLHVTTHMFSFNKNHFYFHHCRLVFKGLNLICDIPGNGNFGFSLDSNIFDSFTCNKHRTNETPSSLWIDFNLNISVRVNPHVVTACFDENIRLFIIGLYTAFRQSPQECCRFFGLFTFYRYMPLCVKNWIRLEFLPIC